MYYHFEIASQIAIISMNLTMLDTKFTLSSNKNEMKDFKDGKLYSELLDSELGKSLLNQRAFTLLLNTDGISSYRHSKLSIWPIFLVINELPSKKRFCIENIKVAGLSVGEAKAEISEFFHPLVKELKQLEYGLVLCNKDDSACNVTFHLIASVFDKPAKAGVLLGRKILVHNFFGGMEVQMCRTRAKKTKFFYQVKITNLRSNIKKNQLVFTENHS